MKVVIPSAGLGTRLLPATKAVPKELFPLYDKPAVHLVVEECINSGMDEIIFVLSEDKKIILDYFKKGDIEKELEEKGKIHLLESLKIFETAKFSYVIQKKPIGLGHAVLCAKDVIGNENFCVVLPDDIFVSEKPALKMLIDVFQREKPQGVVALVRTHDVSKYGIADGSPINSEIILLKKIVEKPPPTEAPSNLAVLGRYIFSPIVFKYLEKEPFDQTGEIQLAGAMDNLCDEEKFLGVILEGVWLDIGSKDGFAKAVKFFSELRNDPTSHRM